MANIPLRSRIAQLNSDAKQLSALRGVLEDVILLRNYSNLSTSGGLSKLAVVILKLTAGLAFGPKTEDEPTVDVNGPRSDAKEVRAKLLKKFSKTELREENIDQTARDLAKEHGVVLGEDPAEFVSYLTSRTEFAERSLMQGRANLLGEVAELGIQLPEDITPGQVNFKALDADWVGDAWVRVFGDESIVEAARVALGEVRFAAGGDGQFPGSRGQAPQFTVHGGTQEAGIGF